MPWLAYIGGGEMERTVQLAGTVLKFMGIDKPTTPAH
jgi:hypothetical protein